MNERRVPSFVLVVTFICALLAGTSEAGRRIAESFFGKNIQEIDEDTAEQLWLHCREELLEITDDFKYIDLYIPQTTSSSENKFNSDIGLLTKRIIHKAIIDLPPQVKHNLLDCLNEESSPSLYSEKESGLINWLNNWRELLSDWFSGPRRYLLRKSHPKNHKHKHKHKHTHKHKHKHKQKHRRGKHKVAPRRVAAPGPAEAPTPASASPAFAPAPLYLVPASSPYPAEAPDFTASPNPAEAPDSTESPTPALVSPAFTPAPLYLVPASSPTPTVHSPVKVPEPSLPPVVKKSPPPLPAMRHPQAHAAPHKPSKSKGNSKESNTAVIAASSVAAFALIALFFCCCLRRRRNRIGPRDRQRDDKPLLNFCSSNHSAGSSQTSHGLENSSKKDFSSSSNVNNLPIRSGTALAEGQLSDAMKGASGDSHAPLPLPPGRTAPPHGISTAPPGKSAPPPPKPPPPPPPAPKAPAPRAPPPPKVVRPPPPNPPKPGSSGRTSLLGPHSRGRSSVGEETNKTSESDGQKAKLKPFFWDKVLAKPDQSMVWHDLKAGSFQFNEEMMENLFGYNTVEKNKNDRNCKRDPSAFEAPQYIQIIDTRKAQNLSILLRALNVTTEEVCEAVMEGNELPTELIQTLLKMAPTTEEELKLRLYSGDLSQLGPAERFLKVLVDIPFAFKRLESLLFMCSIQEEASTLKESFVVLEVACKELKNSRVFLKLLEAVLKTGNRMNDGTYRGGAQAFKLDTLLKLSDVKGIDGKTTLLHFVVLEIIRSEGIRAARRARENHSVTSVKTEDLLEESTQESSEYHRSLGLEVVSNLSNELANVKKAAVVDGDTITATVSRLGHSLKISKDFLNNEMNSVGEESEFRDTLASFVQQAEDDILWILEEEKKMTSLVKSTADYFHGTQGKDEGLRLFMIVRDFLVMVDKVCQEVKNSAIKIPKKEAPPSASSSPSGESHQPPSPSGVQRQRLFPAIKERRKDDSSSDDESSSP